ncbi:hypothetical protein CXQ81_09560 [Pseudomonas sp. 09C 129]|nr:hypothetical protein CXQ81_09560 [Pseudomonas sp. 09C 129]
MGTRNTRRFAQYFCPGNDKQGQNLVALTYKKKQGVLQMKMLTEHLDISIAELALQTSYTTNINAR